MGRILFLGNNSEDTDLRARDYAKLHGMICHGLLSELEVKLTGAEYLLPGCYHTSFLHSMTDWIDQDRLLWSISCLNWTGIDTSDLTTVPGRAKIQLQ